MPCSLCGDAVNVSKLEEYALLIGIGDLPVVEMSHVICVQIVVIRKEPGKQWQVIKELTSDRHIIMLILTAALDSSI